MADKTLAEAKAAFDKAGLATDIRWANYRKARERLSRQRGQYAAEQGFIDASAALGRAQARLAEKKYELRQAVVRETRREGLSRDRRAARVEEIMTALT